jgi:tRNA1(Val) A37 N6-methylase TrmN6
MTDCHCCGTDQQFDRGTARADLQRFRRHGPDPATRLLLVALQDCPLPPEPTLLDIGGGVGTIHHALLDQGFTRATHIDASEAYLAVAAEETQRRGHGDRVTFAYADFRAIASTTAPADVVTLDRVFCCDPDYQALLAAAAEHAQRFLALTYPHARWYTRLYIATKNAWRRVRGQPFRAFVHPPAAMIAVLEAHGLRRRWAGSTWIWQAELFERAA